MRELSYASRAEYHDGLAQRYSSLRACLEAKNHYLFTSTSGQNRAWAFAPHMSSEPLPQTVSPAKRAEYRMPGACREMGNGCMGINTERYRSRVDRSGPRNRRARVTASWLRAHEAFLSSFVGRGDAHRNTGVDSDEKAVRKNIFPLAGLFSSLESSCRPFRTFDTMDGGHPVSLCSISANQCAVVIFAIDQKRRPALGWRDPAWSGRRSSL